MLGGQFALRDVIGVGSFATVYRARDERLDGEVVVKILAENHSLNPEVRERFIAEGRSLRRVHSPHVVTVFDLGETPRQQPYLVLEYADRGSLADRVRTLRERGWRASRSDVLRCARGLAAAVSALHAVGLVHRDLSPGNVLIASTPGEGRADRAGTGPTPVIATAQPTPRRVGSVGRTFSATGTRPPDLLAPDERLLLSDLGLCKDLALNSGLTVASGTEGFRPPEQRRAGVVDERADLWALSALISWLVDGATMPDALTAALRRSLAEDPQDRHPDAATWLRDVETALAPAPAPVDTASSHTQPIPVPAITAPATPALVMSAPPHRTPWKAGVMAVVMLAVGLIGGWVLNTRDTPSSSTASASIAISGPDTVAVGEEATFTAEVAGVAGWVWELPTGEFEANSSEVTLTPTGAGTAQILLRALDGEGNEMRFVLDFRVE